MSSQPSNSTVIDTCTKRLNALHKYVPNGTTPIPIDGVAHTAADVEGIYQACLDARAALATKRAETKAAIAASKNAEAARRKADRALKPWVNNQFGVGSQQAIDFGFPPPKKPQRTVHSKAHAVLQGQATREARGTMGKKERLKVKGVVASPGAPAPVGPATPAPTASPAVAVSAPPPAASPSAGAPPAASTNGAAPH
jgi:hypothetical protein